MFGPRILYGGCTLLLAFPLQRNERILFLQDRILISEI